MVPFFTGWLSLTIYLIVTFFTNEVKHWLIKLKDGKPSTLPKHRRCSRNQALGQPDIGVDTNNQSGCLVLKKLSAEIRLMIWEAALGGLCLHIIQRPQRRLGHIVCPRKESCEVCRGGLHQPVKGSESLSSWSLLSLPMTCKQMCVINNSDVNLQQSCLRLLGIMRNMAWNMH